jgi:hypothetical protein
MNPNMRSVMLALISVILWPQVGHSKDQSDYYLDELAFDAKDWEAILIESKFKEMLQLNLSYQGFAERGFDLVEIDGVKIFCRLARIDGVSSLILTSNGKGRFLIGSVHEVLRDGRRKLITPTFETRVLSNSVSNSRMVEHDFGKIGVKRVKETRTKYATLFAKTLALEDEKSPLGKDVDHVLINLTVYPQPEQKVPIKLVLDVSDSMPVMSFRQGLQP